MSTYLRSPEQEKEAIDLQNDSDNRPADQNHKHPAQKEAGGFEFVPLEEESEGPLQADDKGQTRDKQDLHRESHRCDGYHIAREKYFQRDNWSTHVSDGEKGFVEEKHHPKEEEKDAESCQPHPDFCQFKTANYMWQEEASHENTDQLHTPTRKVLVCLEYVGLFIKTCFIFYIHIILYIIYYILHIHI